MKKMLILLIMLFSLSVQAQSDSTEIQMDTTEVEFDSAMVHFVELPVSTAPGVPDGQPVSKEIGPTGGTIKSDDGRVELIFPKGALTQAATISIQPVTDSIPNGNGKGYQFEPSGLKFAKPVELIFHYTEREAEICPPYLHFLAVQDSNGKWEYMDFENWDSATNSLKILISHFSDYVDGFQLKLNQSERTLKVRESFTLLLTIVTPPATRSPGDDAFPGKQFKWSVEGGRRFGTISRGARWIATYNAPRYLPDRETNVVLLIRHTFINEVVQRSRRGARNWTGTTRVPVTETLATFKCHVKLYDYYQITIIKKGSSVLECGAELEDKSTFKGKFYPNEEPEISLVINSEPTLTKQANCTASRGGRQASYTLTYDPGGCDGPVHVMRDRLSKYEMLISGHVVTDITIEFAPIMVRVMNGKIHYPPTPGISTNSHFFNRQKHIPSEQPPDEPADVKDVNVGNKIKFKGNGEHQEIPIGGSSRDSYRLIIDPLPSE